MVLRASLVALSLIAGLKLVNILPQRVFAVLARNVNPKNQILYCDKLVSFAHLCNKQSLSFLNEALARIQQVFFRWLTTFLLLLPEYNNAPAHHLHTFHTDYLDNSSLTIHQVHNAKTNLLAVDLSHSPEIHLFP